MSKVKHGGTAGGKRERLYVIWQDMKDRCLNVNNAHYNHYGGRGIKVCDEWVNDYLCFRDWRIMQVIVMMLLSSNVRSTKLITTKTILQVIAAGLT